MFKRLKKTFSGSGRSKKSTPPNFGKSLSDESINNPATSQSSCSTDQSINQDITDLGSEFGLLSIDHVDHDSDLSTTINSSSILSQTLYTTAIDITVQQSPIHISDTGVQAMDQSCSNEDFSRLCVTALEDTFEDASDENNYGAKSESTLSVIDPLEDCLAAFGGLSLAHTPNVKPMTQTGLQSEKDGWKATSRGNSPFVVFDLEADGTTVESRAVLSERDNFAAGDSCSAFGKNLHDFSKEKSGESLEVHEKGDNASNYEKLEGKGPMQDKKIGSSMVPDRDNDSGSNITEDDNSDTLFFDALDDVEPPRFHGKEGSSLNIPSRDIVEDIDDHLDSTITNQEDPTRFFKELCSEVDTSESISSNPSFTQQKSSEEAFSDAAESELPKESDSLYFKETHSPNYNLFQTSKADIHSAADSASVASVSKMSLEKTDSLLSSSFPTSLDDKPESVPAMDASINSTSISSPLPVDKQLPLSVTTDLEKLPNSECFVKPRPASKNIAISAQASNETVQTQVDIMAEKNKDITAQLVSQSHSVVEKLPEDEKTNTESFCGDSSQKEDDSNIHNQFLVEKGSYAIDFSTVDLDNYDPFKSSKGLLNSPTANSPPAIQSSIEMNPNVTGEREDKETADITDLVQSTSESSVPLFNFSESLAEKFETSSDTSTIKADSVEATPTRILIPADDNSTVDALVEENLILTIEDGNVSCVVQPSEEIKVNDVVVCHGMSQTTSIDNNENLDSNHTNDIGLENTHSAPENNMDSEITNKIITRGSYSMNFNDFDDPKFDPFNSKKALSIDDSEQITEDNVVSTAESNNKGDEIVSDKCIKASSEDNVTANTKTALNDSVLTSQNGNNAEKFSSVPLTVETDLLVRSASDDILVEDGGELPISKGTYSMGCYQFEDSNSDPFKKTKSLSNDEDGDKLPAIRGAYTLELNDPNFDPFQSKNTMINSPTKDSKNAYSFPAAEVKKTDDLVTDFKDKIVISPSKDKSTGKAEVLTTEFIEMKPSLNSVDVTEKNVASREEDKVIVTSKENAKSAKKKVPTKTAKANQDFSNDSSQKEDPDATEVSNDPPIAKGAYSIDFNKFDDPNFDPFQTKKSLVNDETVDAPPESKGAYSMDLNRFDDPNFNPFQSNKAVVNSPTSEIPDVFTGSKETKTVSMDSIADAQHCIEMTSTNARQDATDQTEDMSSAFVAANTEMKLSKASEPEKEKPKLVTDSGSGENITDVDPVEVLVPKGAYSIDYSKFDDPNFDPFKTTKSLTNDEGVDEIPAPKGAYSVDFDKFDDPNFDPFQSKKAMANSPTENLQESLLSVAKAESENICEVKEKNRANVSMQENCETFSKKIAAKTTNKKAISKSNETPETRKSSKEEVVNPSEVITSTELSVESPGLPIPKGAYSMDLSKFDDPNFDPFKTTKSLVNDESVNEIPAPKGADKFDDPNFDPFQSKKAMANSPTKASCDEFPSAVTQGVSKNSVPKEISADDNKVSEEIKVSKKVSKKVGKSKGKPSEIRSELAALKKKQRENLQQFAEVDDQVVEDPVPAKGAYSMDLNKFDDPNFDPFKTTKSLTNDEGGDKIPAPQGAYSMDFDKFDDPNFDPFQSKKAMANSPTKVLEESPLSYVAKTAESEGISSDVNEKSITDGSSHYDAQPLPKNEGVRPSQKKVRSEVDKSSTLRRSSQEKIVNPSQDTSDITSTEPPTETSEPLIPKGAYSMDLSKFDDPNFDPFKTTKTLTNDEAGDKIPAPKGAYSIDFDKFDDPNFDPFQTKKAMVNSPTKASCDEFPLAVEQAAPENSVPKEISADDNKVSEEIKVPKKMPKKVGKSKGKPSKIRSELAALKKKQRENLQHSAEVDDQVVEDPVPAKGTYSMDLSKFDDPNFDPFKTAKSLTNDEGGDKIPAPKGAYSMDFDKFDDPNFDPFQSKKAMANSPTKTSCDEFPLTVEQTVPENSVPKEISGDDNEVSEEVKVPKKVPKKVGKSKGKPSKIRSELAALKKKQRENLQQSAEVDDQVVEDPVPAKGAYSMDFRKFDDPNFDPFKTTKTLTNDEGGDKILAPKGAYSMDFDKFDDPNFDPFQSKKAMADSPTKTSCDEFPLAVEQTVPENWVPKEISEDDNKVSEEIKVPKKVPKKAEKSKGKPSKIRSELAALKKKQRENLQQSAEIDDQGVEDPVPAKGAYSMDLNKFDDPNFDPFKTTKNLTNDENGDKIPALKGAYSMDFDKFDDPNFDPFKSSKSLPNENDTSKALNPPNQSEETTQFNDPNFNPFKSNKALANSPTEKSSFDGIVQQSEASHIKETSSYSQITTPSVSDKTVLTDESNIQSGKPRPLQSKNSEIRNPEPQVDNLFRPADKVFGDANSLKSWEDLWDKENDNSNSAIESELRKQSLYVQFDPLVEPVAAIERAMQQNQEQTQGPHASYPDTFDNDSNTTLTGEGLDEDSNLMASGTPPYHPAVSQLAQNLVSDKWNANSTQGPSNEALISFSPDQAAKDTGFYKNVKTHYSSEETRKHEEFLGKQQLLRMENEKKELNRKKEALRASIDDMKARVAANKTTERELEKVISGLRNELDAAHVDQRRVLDDIVSAKRVYHDYHIKASELLPVLKAHKQTDLELREELDNKLKTLTEKAKNLRVLKQDAETTKAKLAAEVAKARSATEREIGALQAKYKKEQMTISSLTAALQDRSRENEELTKICDELIAGAEHKS